MALLKSTTELSKIHCETTPNDILRVKKQGAGSQELMICKESIQWNGDRYVSVSGGIPGLSCYVG